MVGWNTEYKQNNEACCEIAMESMGVIRRQSTELQLVNYREDIKHIHVTVKVAGL